MWHPLCPACTSTPPCANLPPACRSLEKPESLASGEVLAAMCHLLSIVLGRVPNQVLRAKFAAGSQVLCAIMDAKQVGGAVEGGGQGGSCEQQQRTWAACPQVHRKLASRSLPCCVRGCRATRPWPRTRCPAWARCWQPSTMQTGCRRCAPSACCSGARGRLGTWHRRQSREVCGGSSRDGHRPLP